MFFFVNLNAMIMNNGESDSGVSVQEIYICSIEAGIKIEYIEHHLAPIIIGFFFD